MVWELSTPGFGKTPTFHQLPAACRTDDPAGFVRMNAPSVRVKLATAECGQTGRERLSRSCHPEVPWYTPPSIRCRQTAVQHGSARDLNNPVTTLPYFFMVATLTAFSARTPHTSSYIPPRKYPERDLLHEHVMRMSGASVFLGVHLNPSSHLRYGLPGEYFGTAAPQNISAGSGMVPGIHGSPRLLRCCP